MQSLNSWLKMLFIGMSILVSWFSFLAIFKSYCNDLRLQVVGYILESYCIKKCCYLRQNVVVIANIQLSGTFKHLGNIDFKTNELFACGDFTAFLSSSVVNEMFKIFSQFTHMLKFTCQQLKNNEKFSISRSSHRRYS